MESAVYTNEALSKIQVRPVARSEEGRYQEQMARHHYLGALPKIGETAWYVATWREQWVAQLSLSAALDEAGHQTHIMSAVGHASKTCHAQKKWEHCP